MPRLKHGHAVGGTQTPTYNGMTLRDYFAIHALGNMVYGEREERVKWAYEVADAMLSEREKK